MKKIEIYVLRYVNSYQDGMALSQCEHHFGTREQLDKFLADDDYTEDPFWSDEEGCANGYEGWQAYKTTIEVPA